AFLERAVRWFESLGIAVEDVMTDNGSGYVSKVFRSGIDALGVRHIRTRPS
ncbi:MAG: IS481 family transposase, partial [Gemmatimonadetes bacterium]|nr:IS481 family transposase [Gemmatimonadota bacterium]